MRPKEHPPGDDSRGAQATAGKDVTSTLQNDADGWAGRLSEQLAERERRQERQQAFRAELTVARAAVKPKLHAARLRERRGGGCDA